MRLFFQIGIGTLGLLLVQFLCRLFLVFGIAQDYSFIDFFFCLLHGFLFDLAFALAIGFLILLFVSIIVSLRIRVKSWHLWLIKGCYVALMTLIAAVSFSSFVSWELLERPFGIDVIEIVWNQGPGRMVADALLLYGFSAIVFLVFFSMFLFAYFKYSNRMDKLFLSPEGSEGQELKSSWQGYVVSGLLLSLVYIFYAVLKGFGYNERQPIPLVAHATLMEMIYDPWTQVYSRYANSHDIDKYYLSGLLGDESISQAFNSLFSETNKPECIDSAFTRPTVNCGVLKEKPEHIFVIIIESYSTWAVNGNYAAKNICPQYHRLSAGGHCWDYVIESAGATAGSLLSIFNNIPYFGRYPAYHGALPSAVAPFFESLGYQTRFYSASFSDWAKIEWAMSETGFDVFEAFADDYTGEEKNEWGLYDHEFYRLMQESFDPDTPSFTVLLTTSNHAPFNVPVGKRGYNENKIEFCDNFDDNAISRGKVSHMWYADNSMGEFIDQMLEKYPKSLFVVTGDHASRSPPVERMNEIYRRCVPCLLYGPNVLTSKGIRHEQIITHIDILTTVYEIVAKEGASYVGLGRNVFNKEKEEVSLGNDKYFTDGSSLYYWQRIGDPIKVWPEEGQYNLSQELFDRYRRYVSLAFYRCTTSRFMPGVIEDDP